MRVSDTILRNGVYLVLVGGRLELANHFEIAIAQGKALVEVTLLNVDGKALQATLDPKMVAFISADRDPDVDKTKSSGQIVPFGKSPAKVTIATLGDDDKDQEE